MKAKRLVSFVTASAMMLTMVAPALAATTEEIGRLTGLGVVTGYTAGGADFKPEQTITRAEFAAVAVRLLGLENAANAAKGATKFKDVAGSNWASGYINLATGNGVIKGYPDGTFKPEGKVTYAESFAMLVRVLGYEPQVTGTWPTNYVGKASQIGLLDGLSTTDFNAAALRGNIFTAADNALDVEVMKQTAFGADAKWEVTDKTLLEDKLKYVKVDNVSIDALAITDSSMDADEVSIDDLDADNKYTGKYTVVGNLDVNSMLGLTGTAWLNTSDDKIVLFQSDDKVEADQIKAINGTTITLKVKDDDYTTTLATKYYKNFKTATSAALAAGQMVNVVLKNDDIKAIYVFDLVTDKVDRVDAANDKIYLSEGGGSITLADNYAIVKDGKAIKLADIKVGDVIEYNKEAGDKYYVRISSGTATGKMTATLNSTLYGADQTYKVTVGATTYTTAIGVKYSTDDGKNYDAVTAIGDLSEIFDKDVTVYMNSFGKVAFIKSGTANETAENAVLIKGFTSDTGADGSKYYVRVMKSDGTETFYEVDEDTTLNNAALADTPGFVAPATTGDNWAAAIAAKTLVKLELTSDGKVVDNFKTFATADVVGPAAATKVDDNSTITVAGKTVQVQADTKFFTIKTAGAGNAITDAKFITWGDVKSTYNANMDGFNTTIVFDGAKAKYVFIDGAKAITSDTQLGILDSKGLAGSDKIVNVLFPAGMKAVKFNWTTQATGTLYTMTIDADNKSTNVTPAVYKSVYTTADQKTYEVRSISSGINNTKILKLRFTNAADQNYDFDVIVKDGYTTYYDVSNSAVKADGVNVGDKVTVYDLLDKDGNYKGATNVFTALGDGIIDYVVIDN